jgi:hypothetical protein
MKIQKIKSYILSGAIAAGFVALSMLSACGGGHDTNNDKETPGRGMDTTGRDMNEEDYVKPTSLEGIQTLDAGQTYEFTTL